MAEKPLVWLGSSLEDLRHFPADARRAAGHQLHRLQWGLEPEHWKPMPTVGTGVREIRIQTGRAFRILYLTKFAEAIYVLHTFEKRTQRTSQVDLDLAQKRLRDLLRLRGEP
jgi:phage-related protein